MMKFEEQFPEFNKVTGGISRSDIQEHCLSKQRVKEVIKRTALRFQEGCIVSPLDLIMVLTDELGLE